MFSRDSFTTADKSPSSTNNEFLRDLMQGPTPSTSVSLPATPAGKKSKRINLVEGFGSNNPKLKDGNRQTITDNPDMQKKIMNFVAVKKKMSKKSVAKAPCGGGSERMTAATTAVDRLNKEYINTDTVSQGSSQESGSGWATVRTKIASFEKKKSSTKGVQPDLIGKR